MRKNPKKNEAKDLNKTYFQFLFLVFYSHSEFFKSGVFKRYRIGVFDDRRAGVFAHIERLLEASEESGALGGRRRGT